MPRMAFLGPHATFTEQALRSLPESVGAELVPCAGSPAVLAAVRDGSADAGCVPIENTVEGAVPAVLDGLVADPPLVIVREALVAVRFAVMVRPGTRAADVRSVASHSHGVAQTRDWLARHLPQADVLLSTSTAEAAAQVARGDVDAAVAAPLAAEQHGLDVLADDVADNAGAVTRFALVSRPGPPPPPTGRDRTSLAATTQNRPGALLGPPHRARRAGDRPDAHRVPPDQGPARRVLVPPRLHRARRRARDGGGARGAAPALRPGAVPRLLPACERRPRVGGRPGRPAVPIGARTPPGSRRRRSGSPGCATGAGRDERRSIADCARARPARPDRRERHARAGHPAARIPAQRPRAGAGRRAGAAAGGLAGAVGPRVHAVRAQQTAAPVAAAHGLDVGVVEGVQEIFCGDLEGRSDVRRAGGLRHRLRVVVAR